MNFVLVFVFKCSSESFTAISIDSLLVYENKYDL